MRRRLISLTIPFAAAASAAFPGRGIAQLAVAEVTDEPGNTIRIVARDSGSGAAGYRLDASETLPGGWSPAVGAAFEDLGRVRARDLGAKVCCVRRRDSERRHELHDL